MNKIRTLEPFSKCPSLKVLFLRANEIADFAELKHLQELKHLKSLWLLDNPIAQDDNYRKIIVQMLPNLIRIDEAEVTDLERPRNDTLAIPEPFAPPKPTSHLNETFPDLSVESPIEEPKIKPRTRPAAARTSPVKPLEKVSAKPQPAKPQEPVKPPAQPKPQPKAQPKPQEPAKPKPAPKSGVKSSDTATGTGMPMTIPDTGQTWNSCLKGSRGRNSTNLPTTGVKRRREKGCPGCGPNTVTENDIRQNAAVKFLAIQKRHMTTRATTAAFLRYRTSRILPKNVRMLPSPAQAER